MSVLCDAEKRYKRFVTQPQQMLRLCAPPLRWLGSTQETRLALFFEPVAVPFDIERRRVVQESVQNRRSQDVIIEDLAPIEKTFVGGHDHAGLFVTANDQTKE